MEALYNDQSAVIRLNGRHNSHSRLREELDKVVLCHHIIFHVYTDSVVREADIEELGTNNIYPVVGKFVYNLNAQMTPRFV